MFKDGSHDANPYCELFNLMMQASRLARMEQAWCRLGTGWYIASAPGEFIEPERLDQVKYHLMSAEAARCRGKVDGVHHNLLTSALYFEETGDQSGCRAFYVSLLKTSLKIRGDMTQVEKESEVNWPDYETYLLKGKFTCWATQLLDSFHSITEGQLWQRDTLRAYYGRETHWGPITALRDSGNNLIHLL